jgi:hypothetical protein
MRHHLVTVLEARWHTTGGQAAIGGDERPTTLDEAA